MKYLDFLLLFFHRIFALISDNETTCKLNMDLITYAKQCGIELVGSGNRLYLNDLLMMLRKEKEFRNVYYWRIGKTIHRYHFSSILKFILPPLPTLSLGIPSENAGGGMFIQHGNSTIIHAKQIGEHFFVNQNVTIGDSGKGIPIIGNNVKVCTGAVVLGPISIGNNVIIGANATVVKDVPDNCTVIPAASYIMKKNGIRVLQKL